MSEAAQEALKKAIVAALVAGITVFIKEYGRSQERIEQDRERR